MRGGKWHWFCAKTPRPSGYWNDVNNQKKFVIELAEKIGVADRKEWPNVLTRKVFAQHGGGSLFNKYNGIRNLFESLFPEEKFTFERKPRCYWDVLENQRDFMNQYMTDHNMPSLDDWNQVKVIKFRKSGGRALLAKYPNFCSLLSAVYPDHPWDLDRRKQRPHGYWKDVNNRRSFVQQQARSMGIESKEDWKGVYISHVLKRGAKALSTYYKDSIEAIEDSFPEIEKVRVKHNPKYYWDDIETQKQFFEDLRKKLKLRSLSDWNQVSTSTVLKNHGDAVLSKYASLADALATIYPHHPWKKERRLRVPRNHWGKKENVMEFLQRVEKRYEVNMPCDWYRISVSQIRAMGGSGLLVRYNGLFGLLREFYPSVEWDKKLLNSKQKRAEQRWLYLQVKMLFPDREVVEDYLFNAERESGVSVEFDIFVPSLQLALEYQGAHHYKEIPSFGTLELYITRDKEKAALAKKLDIHLVFVPFTWNGKLASLLTLIGEKVSIRKIFNENFFDHHL